MSMNTTKCLSRTAQHVEEEKHKMSKIKNNRWQNVCEKEHKMLCKNWMLITDERNKAKTLKTGLFKYYNHIVRFSVEKYEF